MLKRPILVIAALAALGLAACAGPAPTATPQPTNTPVITPTPEATEEPVIAEATEEATPEVTPEATEEATPEVTSEATEEATPEVTPVTVTLPAKTQTGGLSIAVLRAAQATPAPEMTPEATAEATPEMTPEAAMPEMTPEATAEATPEMTPEAAMPEMTPEATAEATPEMTPEATAEVTPVAVTLPAKTQTGGLSITALRAAQATPAPELTPEATPDATPGMTPEATPDATGEAMPAATAAPAVAEGGITWTCPEDFSGQRLSVYNWAEYIGNTTIQDFTRLCEGVTVVLDYFDTNETLITRMRTGNPGYDVAFPNDYAIAILANEGLLERVNLENIPNYANVADRWKSQYFDPNNEWGVPYLWSTYGIVYNRERVSTSPVSWMDFFTHEGPVQWIDDYRGMFGPAFWLMGVSASSTDPEEIRKAAEFLKANGSNAVNISGGFTEALENGEVDMILTYSSYAYSLPEKCQCDRFAYVVPQEGSAVDVTMAVVLRGARNQRLAEAFIDYLNDPFVAAQIVNDTGYNTTNQAALDSGFIRPEVLNNPALFVGPETMARLEFYRPITEAEGEYQMLWDEIRIQLGIGG
ncbi:extracellular solute-binding protein (plasmid) [Aggregatilineales bacterium SYSU G02658]